MLVEHPNPILGEVAEPITDEFGSDWLKELIDRMEEVTYHFGANGLAAVQIGVNKAVIIYKDKSGTLNTLCNPKIIARSGKVKSYGEGCLCVPGQRFDIRRSKEVKVKAHTIDGEEILVKEKGFPAIILQHEIDHLNGITVKERGETSGNRD